MTIVFWLALWALDLPAPLVLALAVGALSPALLLIVGLIGWQLCGFGGAIYGFILLVPALSVTDALRIEQDRSPTVPPTSRSQGPDLDAQSG